MNTASENRTYEEVSSEFMALSKNPNAHQAKVSELAQLRQTLFMGNTLRGLLLNAYAFGTMGTIALYAGIGAFVGAAVFLVLGLLGLWHAKTAADLPALTQRAPATV